MSQLLNTTIRAASSERAAFAAYITAGFPKIEDTVPILLNLQKNGVDIVEVGIPHSDPVADGKTIQHSSTVALQNGVTPAMCFEFIASARKQGLTVPVIFMTYYNLIYQCGDLQFVQKSKKAGVNGFIVVDLPIETGSNFFGLCHDHGLSVIPLIARTTTIERLRFINRHEYDLVYAVSMLGVTGKVLKEDKELQQFLERVQKYVKSPIALGFGIENREQFVSLGSEVQVIVIGSALIKYIMNNPGVEAAVAAGQFAKKITNGEMLSAAPDTKTKTSLPPIIASSPLPGSFGEFGGTYSAETLMNALNELEEYYSRLKNDEDYNKELKSFYSYVGRPTPLYEAKRLSKEAGGARIFLKREDLCHTGAHKINNAIGQAVLTTYMGKTRIIAETGAGQHGVATATVCAKMGLPCTVYMGSEDMERQSLNVFRMKMLGAEVVAVDSGSKTLKDAVNEAMRDWVTNVKTTHFLIGSAIGPHPFPTIVRDLQSVIGKETKEQLHQLTGRLPDAVVACVGGGSNAIGMFHPFVDDEDVRLFGVEAAGEGVKSDRHCATLGKGTPGVFQGTKTMLIQDDVGQIKGTHSISAGLDYPGVGPEHAHYAKTGRAKYESVTDSEALEAFQHLSRTEGIIPALESSHAIAYGVKLAKEMNPDQIVVINCSGRGDKDLGIVAKALGVKLND